MVVRVAEHFYSVQGEGPYSGVPSVFLRLAGCNLSCGLTESNVQEFEKGQAPESGATWICDTIDVWREADWAPTANELVEEWRSRGWLKKFRDGAHLVVTGGEPLVMGNQESFVSVYADLLTREPAIAPFVEVETNGTVVPKDVVRNYVNQFNVSLKLGNSGMDWDDRFKEEAIDTFIDIHRYETDQDATFKFVVGHEADVVEVEMVQGEFDIPDTMISLMPAGQTQDQLRLNYPLAAEECKKRGWRFSPRLQVDVWGEVTGV